MRHILVLYWLVVAGFYPCGDARVFEEITKPLNVDKGNDSIYDHACWI